jgi:hypothetical protein
VLLNLIFVEHPGQFNVPVGAIRFDLSLRGAGERLVSSITSRTGFSTQPACRQFCRDVPHELNFRWQGGLRVFRSLNLVKSCRILPWR